MSVTINGIQLVRQSSMVPANYQKAFVITGFALENIYAREEDSFFCIFKRSNNFRECFGRVTIICILKNSLRLCVFRNFTSKTTTIFAKFGPSRRRSINTSICELHSTNAFQVSVHFALLPGIKIWVVTKMVDVLFLETILYFGNFKWISLHLYFEYLE